MTRIRRTSLLRVAVLLAALTLTACTAASTSAPPTAAPVATTAPAKPASAAVSPAAAGSPSASPASAGSPVAAAPLPTVGKAPAGKKIGLALSTLNNPFFVSLRDGAQKAADQAGVQLVVADDANDSARQADEIGRASCRERVSLTV